MGQKTKGLIFISPFLWYIVYEEFKTHNAVSEVCNTFSNGWQVYYWKII